MRKLNIKLIFFLIYRIYKMAYLVSATLHSLSTWWHPNIEEELSAFFFFFESSALKFVSLPVNSREMIFGFG